MSSIIGRIPQDANREAVLAGLSNADGLTVTTLYVDPTTHALLTTSASGGGATQVAMYNTTLPTLVDGATTPLIVGSRGSLNVQLYSNNAATPLGSKANNADALAVDSSSNSLSTASFGRIFNGTTYDRIYEISNGMNSAGVGIQATGIVGQFDDTATGTVTENQFAPVRITPVRALMTEQVYSYSRAVADAQVKATAGFIHTVNIAPTGTVTPGVITIYDNAAETGTVIWSATVGTTLLPVSLQLDVTTTSGIYVGFDASVANVQVTISYR